MRCPGLFDSHVRRQNEPRKRQVVYVKRPAVRIRRKKSPKAEARRLASTDFFVYFVVQTLLVIGLTTKKRNCMREPEGTVQNSVYPFASETLVS